MPSAQETETKQRPRSVEFKDLKPERIGETLGWPYEKFEDSPISKTWWFKGPRHILNFNIMRIGSIDSGSASFDTNTESEITNVTLHCVERIEFNKAAGEVILKGSEGEFLIVKKNGHFFGTASVSFIPRN